MKCLRTIVLATVTGVFLLTFVPTAAADGPVVQGSQNLSLNARFDVNISEEDRLHPDLYDCAPPCDLTVTGHDPNLTHWWYFSFQPPPYENAEATGQSASWTYNQLGEYVITHVVTASDGSWNRTIHQVKVDSADQRKSEFKFVAPSSFNFRKNKRKSKTTFYVYTQKPNLTVAIDVQSNKGVQYRQVGRAKLSTATGFYKWKLQLVCAPSNKTLTFTAITWRGDSGRRDASQPYYRRVRKGRSCPRN